MKILTTAGLTELIAKIKSSFIKVDDTITATTVDIDSTPTTSSTNLVSSGGVKTALDSKQDNLPQVVNDRYLHTNSSGQLEWATVGGSSEDNWQLLETITVDGTETLIQRGAFWTPEVQQPIRCKKLVLIYEHSDTSKKWQRVVLNAACSDENNVRPTKKVVVTDNGQTSFTFCYMAIEGDRCWIGSNSIDNGYSLSNAYHMERYDAVPQMPLIYGFEIGGINNVLWAGTIYVYGVNA